MSTHDGGPAFPAPIAVEAWMVGMTLRDYFAASALSNIYTANEGNPAKVAEWAYQVADAMLAAREPRHD